MPATCDLTVYRCYPWNVMTICDPLIICDPLTHYRYGLRSRKFPVEQSELAQQCVKLLVEEFGADMAKGRHGNKVHKVEYCLAFAMAEDQAVSLCLSREAHVYLGTDSDVLGFAVPFWLLPPAVASGDYVQYFSISEHEGVFPKGALAAVYAGCASLDYLPLPVSLDPKRVRQILQPSSKAFGDRIVAQLIERVGDQGWEERWTLEADILDACIRVAVDERFDGKRDTYDSPRRELITKFIRRSIQCYLLAPVAMRRSPYGDRDWEIVPIHATRGANHTRGAGTLLTEWVEEGLLGVSQDRWKAMAALMMRAPDEVDSKTLDLLYNTLSTQTTYNAVVEDYISRSLGQVSSRVSAQLEDMWPFVIAWRASAASTLPWVFRELAAAGDRSQGCEDGDGMSFDENCDEGHDEDDINGVPRPVCSRPGYLADQAPVRVALLPQVWIDMSFLNVE